MANKSKKQAILLVAVEIANEHSYATITRDEIAWKAGVGMGTVTNHLGTMRQIKRAVVRYAIRTEVLAIIAQAVALKDPLVHKIDPDLKRRALASL